MTRIEANTRSLLIVNLSLGLPAESNLSLNGR